MYLTITIVYILTILFHLYPIKENLCCLLYISICVKIITCLLPVKQSDLFSLHYVSNNMCWCYLLARYPDFPLIAC